jgi:hypothetical protein
MKILLSIYSGVSRISCVAISHSLAMKVYNCLFVVRLKKYILRALSHMKMENMINIDKIIIFIKIQKQTIPAIITTCFTVIAPF